MYLLEFDGMFKRLHNQTMSVPVGLMCYGWLISKKGIIVAQGYGAFARGKNASSNIAEYLAMIEGLDALIDMGVKDEPVIVSGDAKSIIEQMQGSANVTSSHIKSHNERARKLAEQFEHISWEWKPRKYNHAADSLSHRAMKHIRRDRQRYQALIDHLALSIKRSPSSTKLLPVSDLRVYQPAYA